MNSFLKSGFLLGLGAAVAGKEKFDETITKLVEKGSMTQSEADSLFDEWMKKGETKNEEWNKEFRELAKNQLRELGFVSREELDHVQAQLVLLQEELIQLRNNLNDQGKDKADQEQGMENIPPGFSKDVD